MHTYKQKVEIDSMDYWPLVDKVMQKMKQLIQMDENFRTVFLRTCLDGTSLCCADVYEFLELAKSLEKQNKCFNTWVDDAVRAVKMVDDTYEIDERIP